MAISAATDLIRALKLQNYDFVPQASVLIAHPQLQSLIAQAYAAAVVKGALDNFLDDLSAVSIVFEPLHLALESLSFSEETTWSDVVHEAKRDDHPGLSDAHVEWLKRRDTVIKRPTPLAGIRLALIRQLADAGIPPNYVWRQAWEIITQSPVKEIATLRVSRIVECYRSGWPGQLLNWLLASDAALYIDGASVAPLIRRPVPSYLKVGDGVPKSVRPSSTDVIAHVVPDGYCGARRIIILGDRLPRIIMAKGFYPYLVQEHYNGVWHLDGGCLTRPEAEKLEAEITADGGTARIVDQLAEHDTYCQGDI